MNQPLTHKYQQDQALLVAVDCIIFGVRENELQLLLFKRKVEPLAGEWSLLGDFVKPGESVESAAQRVLHELTDLDHIYMEQLHCFGGVERDPGGRVISVAYWSLIQLGNETDSPDHHLHEAVWFPVRQVPRLILDHGYMVDMATQHIRERAKFYPLGVELVPEEFTMAQLLKVYEAIFMQQLDDRNFRKKLMSSGLLTRLEKKDMSTSRKGSYLYRFNQERYQELLKQGYDFGF